MRRSWMGVLALGLAACSSATPAAGDGGVTTTQACQDQAQASCNLAQICSEGFAILRSYGTFATCVTQQTQLCETALNAPQTSRTAIEIEACATAEKGERCADYAAGNPPPACLPPAGGIASGAACAIAAQCQSTFCAIPDNQICGVCAPPPQAGSACTAIGCGPGLVCGGAQVCLAQAGDGGACVDRLGCQWGLGCTGLDAGGAPGSCLPAALLGQPCDFAGLKAPPCEARLGLTCFHGLCAALSLASAGASCGTFDAGPRACAADAGPTCILRDQVQCSGGGDCVESQGAASCLPPAASGNPCDVSAGPGCLTPARCVVDAGTSGVCLPLTPLLCQ